MSRGTLVMTERLMDNLPLDHLDHDEHVALATLIESYLQEAYHKGRKDEGDWNAILAAGADI